MSRSVQVSVDSSSPRRKFALDLPSPRVGEIPPALSPLDAFAQQSRQLAKIFDESQQQGRRISRLEHSLVASEFQQRPTFLRSISGISGHIESTQNTPSTDEIIPLPNLAVTHAGVSDRPISQYPLFGSAANSSARNTIYTDPFAVINQVGEQQQQQREVNNNYFGFDFQRTRTPDNGRHFDRSGDAASTVPSLTESLDSIPSLQTRIITDDSVSSRINGERGLIPPISPPQKVRGKKSLVSIRSVMDGVDEPPRKLSETIQISRARSPFTPDPQITSRSPSIISDTSIYHDEWQRPSPNFSRPMSISSNKEYRPSFSSPTRSFEIRQSMEPLRDQSPLRKTSGVSTIDPELVINELEISIENETESEPRTSVDTDGDNPTSGDQSNAATYIYAKYSLPRGRVVDRASIGEHPSRLQNQFKWEDKSTHITPSSSIPSITEQCLAVDDSRTPIESLLAAQKSRSQSTDGISMSIPRVIMHKASPSTPSVQSTSTDKTIRGHTRNTASEDIASMSAEEHLEKGIESHSNGSLSKSTYHLRLSAKAGHPTGMLLYALACRHGWGMRANQAEGVAWLKKAVDNSSVDMLEVRNIPSIQQSVDPNVKARKAQFALAVYELGMSHMNGWGTPKDKTLGLRCFEVAGNWGDLDALAEAGSCYAVGIGCKKDLKHAAALYRRAAEGGMNMAGNSW